MRELLFLFGKTNSRRNVSGIDRNRSGMAGRIPISSVKRRHKGGCK